MVKFSTALLTSPDARDAYAGAVRRRRLFEAQASPDLTVRRGARVLLDDGAPHVGYVEGESFYGASRTWVVRVEDGSLRWVVQGLARSVAVDAGTVLVEDQNNNVNRLCNVRGDGAAGEPVRCWLVVSAVSDHRYLVKHLDTSEVRVVGHGDMTNLY